MGGFRVAIPSYKRAELIKRYTLAFLKREGFFEEQIDVFVASEAELAAYKAAGVDKLVSRIIVGEPGIHRQRAWMERFYPDGSDILFVDDDIRGVKRIYPETLPILVQKMFEISEGQGCRLWGIYPTDHGLCLKDRVMKGLSFIIGAFYGLRISSLKPAYPAATTEDFTRTLEFWKADGFVLRAEGLGVATKFCNPDGGLADHRAGGGQEAEMLALVAAWPNEVILRRRTGRQTDVRMKKVKREKLEGLLAQN